MAEQRGVRPWSFWRTGFWTRPAFLVVYAVCALATVPFAARGGVDAVAAGRALDDGRLCDHQVTRHCLRPVAGRLQGPLRHVKSVNDGWDLLVAGRQVDSFEVGPHDSSTLEAGRGDATALLYRGHVMAVQVASGAVVTPTREGARGATGAAGWSLVGLGAALGLGQHGRRKRRILGGWWRVEGPPTDPLDPAGPLLALSGIWLVVLMELGASWWVAAGTVGTVLGAVLVVARRSRTRRRRRASPRHARGPKRSDQLDGV